ncbi:hypothetical protein ABPG77_002224 [Micractinium sp. CCAP 211/92]
MGPCIRNCRYVEVVARINALRPTVAALSDEQLAGKTAELRRRLEAVEAGGAGGASWQGERQQRQRRGGPALLGGMPEDIVVEAFAVVREAAQRVLGIRHYDVQLLGGLALHEGQVAEMATGEGKTLVATLPAYVNALTGRGVHVVTVNDYLAKRDAEWVGKVFSFLGLSVGVVTSETKRSERIAPLAKDITYITAYELVFAYLSDYNVTSPGELIVRRPLHYALVDEVDSILIDEAINPFIITLPSPSGDLRLQQARWSASDKIIRQLEGSTYVLNSDACTEQEWAQLEAAYDVIARPKYRSATVTARGMVRAVFLLATEGLVVLATDAQGRLAVGLLFEEQPGQAAVQLRLGYADAAGAFGCGGSGGSSSSFFLDAQLGSREAAADELRRRGFTPLAQPSWAQLEAAVPLALWEGEHAWGVFLTASARAHHCYFKDVHYLLRDDRVVIIDLPTGRERANSVWQLGLHQAVEAKHGVKVRGENVNAASVSYQAFFRYYKKLAGMTGTGATEEAEFSEAYGLAVVRVPPHRPSRRRDHPMQLYFYEEGRNAAIQHLLREAAEAGRPVLVGTGSVQESADVLRSVVQPFVEEYGLQVNVSLLNADPAQTRFEAAFIAQAGLPQSITIATNLAGRGTDILLGGNPKGLVQMLLENKLLGLMAPEAPDLDAYLGKVPLHHLETIFRTPEDMQRGLPPALYQSFRAVSDGVARMVAAATAAAQEAAPAAAPGAPGEQWLPLLRLPWRERGKGGADHATRDAAAWLGQQVEAAEVAKAHLRLHQYLGRRDWCTAADEAIQKERRRQQQQAGESSSPAGQPELEAALQRFILLQWLWFNRLCAEYAEQARVRAAGGLRVIVASLPDTRRSELQLRGRSGRQGDPGDTHLVLSFDDPQLRLSNEAAAKAAQGPFGEHAPHGLAFKVLPWGVRCWQMAANMLRDAMRRYDEVVDKYRRHVYRLRRATHYGGGSAGRRHLLHTYFQDLAHSIVSRLVDASRPPSGWDLPLLARHLYALVNQTGLEERIDFEVGPMWFGRQPWRVEVVGTIGGPSVASAIAFDPDQLASDLLEAFAEPGERAACAALVPLGAFEQAQQAGQLAAVLEALPPQPAQQAGEQPAAAGQQQRAELVDWAAVEAKPRLRLRERRELAALRSQMAAYSPAPSLPEAGGGGGGGALGGGGEPAFSGRHARQARLLVSWVAEFLAVQYRNKRELLKAWYRSPANTDVDRSQRIVSARAYSSFDPLQEFQLERRPPLRSCCWTSSSAPPWRPSATSSLVQVAGASRQELTMGRPVLQNGADAADGEDAAEDAPSLGSGRRRRLMEGYGGQRVWRQYWTGGPSWRRG